MREIETKTLYWTEYLEDPFIPLSEAGAALVRQHVGGQLIDDVEAMMSRELMKWTPVWDPDTKVACCVFFDQQLLHAPTCTCEADMRRGDFRAVVPPGRPSDEEVGKAAKQARANAPQRGKVFITNHDETAESSSTRKRGRRHRPRNRPAH